MIATIRAVAVSEETILHTVPPRSPATSAVTETNTASRITMNPARGNRKIRLGDAYAEGTVVWGVRRGMAHKTTNDQKTYAAKILVVGSSHQASYPA